MNDILKHDSTKTFKPIIYQFLIALEKCFEMQGDESIWIEKYGDVTNSSGEQIEVKDYQSDLTDLDHNVWKTLKNWLDEGFDISHYHSFVLLTTQNLSKTTKFIGWNEKDKKEKLATLKEIASKYNEKENKSKNTEKLLNGVLDTDKEEKLIQILDKFIIESSYIKDEELYKTLKDKYCKGILSEKQDDFINALMGYIINPDITTNGWKITYDDFTARFRVLTEEYNSKTIIFPQKYINAPISKDEEKEHLEYLFVKKIKDISYDDKITEAIKDFINTRKTIANELSHYIDKSDYKNFEETIYRKYKATYENLSLDTDSSNQVKNSKKLYNSCIGANVQNFRNFNDTPYYFRNGFLHEMADGNIENKIIHWKIEVDDE